VVTALGNAKSGSLYVINTCAVTSVAERKSRHLASTIATRDPNARIVVMGCAAEAHAKQFTSQNVIKIFGNNKTEVADFVFTTVGEATCLPQTATTQRQQYFLKVQDGCDNSCAFCIVSKLRGSSRSRAIEDIMTELRSLPTQPNQITITGVNLCAYRDGEFGLVDLCSEINTLGIPFRLSSLYVDSIDSVFVEKLSKLENRIPHFHLSIQSCSDVVLVSMGRRYNATEVEAAVVLLRKTFAETKISADIIVGFPTETEDEFESSRAVLKKLNLDHLHVFPYSPRPGTAAAELKQLPQRVVKERVHRLQS